MRYTSIELCVHSDTKRFPAHIFTYIRTAAFKGASCKLLSNLHPTAVYINYPVTRALLDSTRPLCQIIVHTSS
jgi:hypothetical protein